MKKISLIVIAILVLVMTAACGQKSTTQGSSGKPQSTADAGKQYVLKLSNDSTPSNPKVEAVLKWAEAVQQKSNGRLKIDVFHSAQLYNDRDAIQATSMGNIDMSYPPANLLTTLDPNWGIFELPSMFGLTYDQYRKLVTSEFGQKLSADLEKKLKVKVLGYYHMGNWMWASNKKLIEKPEDFKGQKVRIIGGILQETSMKAFGAGPTQIAWPEVYSALQQNVIDGLETTMAGANQIKGWEVMKNISYSKHKNLPYIMMVNQASWDKLPADLQKLAQDTFNESQVAQDALVKKVDDAGVETFKKNGTNVIELSQEQLKVFKDKLIPSQDKLITDLKMNTEMVKLASKFIE
jgi:tripartite ATP-independent transporter DctP family solute receptor